MKTDRHAFLFLMIIAYAGLLLPLLPAARVPAPAPADAAAPATLSYLSPPAADPGTQARSIGS
jgi:hypothetical protein